jgi:predicted Zn-dependent protease
VRRPGWRDLPRVGPSHLLLEPDARTAPSALIDELESGYYFLGLDGPVSVDWEERRISMPVYGFAIKAGRSSRPVRGARASAPIAALFAGVRRTARDLRFVPTPGGYVGSPSVLVDALSVEKA